MAQKDSFIYQGFYYEYSKQELSPDVYLADDDDVPLDLLMQRARAIKSMRSTYVIQSMKDNPELKKLSDRYFDCILETEEQIEQLFMEKGIFREWYHSSIGTKKENVVLLENQLNWYCPECERLYEVKEQASVICPKCGAKMKHVNRYLHLAEQCNKKACAYGNDGDFRQAISMFGEQIAHLKKVNQYDEEYYDSAQKQIGIANVDICRCEFEIGSISSADRHLEEGIKILETLKNEERLPWYEWSSLIDAYLIKEWKLSENSRSSNSVEECFRAIQEILKKGESIIEFKLQDQDSQFADFLTEEQALYESASLKSYFYLCQFYIRLEPQNPNLKKVMHEYESRMKNNSQHVPYDQYKVHRDTFDEISRRMAVFQHNRFGW